MPLYPSTSDTFAPPVHVAVIMDGNGRWAARRGLPRVAGHQRGVEAVRRTVEAASDLGVRYLTLFGFSSENWKRPQAEIEALMGLLRLYIRSEAARLNKNGIRLRFIGDRRRFAPDLQAMMTDAEDSTRGNVRLDLIVALNYGGRQDLAEAMRQMAADVKEGRLDPEEIDEAHIGARLFTAGIPDPDLLIRTSGEQRISNFLLWQCAYAELWFTEVLWPDFGRDELAVAIEAFQDRHRRFGGL